MHRPFKFDAEKTIQAVAFLLRREPARRMNYMRLLKLLYIAEREVLAESGVPLTGSPAIAMERGPVLEDVYSMIRSTHPESGHWERFFRVDHYSLAMERDPGAGALSKYVVSKLDEVANRHEDDDEWALVELTHRLPEWIANNPGQSSKPIHLEQILEAMGCAEDCERIVEDARAREATREFFERAG